MLTFVPLLSVQRELYRLPRSRERFEAYLATMIDAETGDVRLPLTSMNPMAKDHVPALLDQLLALGADDIGKDATDEIAGIGDFRVTTVLADDLLGGWTNRYAAGFSSRFEMKAMMKRGWIVATLWSSEPADPTRVRQTVAAAIRRAEFVVRHGIPQTLAARMEQEGYALSRAGITLAQIDFEDVRRKIEPLLQTTDMRTSIECLFGDVAARSLGFTERGLPDNAGLALALEKESACDSRLRP
ncbi:MAG TPA: hypothetical protein VKU62_04035 [Thermoanaerobaculia bacterium]|nr:hypothetical protein [Thermoanaerobaculia bacterium]